MHSIVPDGRMSSPVQPSQPESRQSNLSGKPEVAAEPAPLEETKAELISPKYAELARREKRFRAEAEKLKAERLAFDSEKKRYETDFIPKKRLSEDPLGVFNEAGVTYDQITSAAMNQPSPQDLEIKKLYAKINELEQGQSKFKEEMTVREKQDYDVAVGQISESVKTLAESDPRFSLIKDWEEEQSVVDMITETFEKTGKLISEEEALLKKKEELLELGTKLARHPEVQERLRPKEETPKEEPKREALKTITHAQAPSVPGKISDRDRMQRAILAFKGQLNK